MRILGRLFVGLIVVLVGGMVVTCGSAPVRWALKQPPAWRVTVVDKTVPHADYREHAALFWVLRHEKIASADSGRDWRLDRDYIGFVPDPNDADDRGHGRRLVAADLDEANLLYLADSYGVYAADFAESTPGQAAQDLSPMLYGGMFDDEVRTIRDFVDRGGHLIGEFNTFASPTSGAARAQLETLFGLDWSGWTGRFFPELSDDSEVPPWARRNWREHYEEEWEHEGPGYLLVNEDTRLFVLREGVDYAAPGLTIERQGDEPLLATAIDGVRFNYWFDIVQPRPGSTVPALFRIETTEQGSSLLRGFGVPRSFPAVVLAHEAPLRMYFAGDFSDSIGGLGPHWAEGLPWINKLLVGMWFPSGADQEPFYWGFYIPMLRQVLTTIDPKPRPRLAAGDVQRQLPGIGVEADDDVVDEGAGDSRD